MAFKQKEYEKSIDFWQRTLELIPDDEAYYLNISHAYILMDQLEKSLEFLKIVDQSGYKSNNGKYEFLLASIYAKRGNILKTCGLAKKSIKLGYNDAEKLLKYLDCFN